MKIIHLVLGKVNPERMNGVNKVVYEMATRQHAAGYDVEVWGITANPVHDYPARNFTTQLFPTGPHPFAIATELKQALSALPANVVVHMHGGFIPVFSRLSALLQRLKKPFVYTPHGSYNVIALKKGGWKKFFYMPLFEKPLLKRAALVHSLGKSEVDGLHQISPGKKSVLIPYGFDTTSLEHFHAAAMQPNGAETSIVTFCGRIDTHTKGLDLLMAAMVPVCQQLGNVQLWIIGDSNQREALQQQAQSLGLGDKVIFYGARYGEEKMLLLEKSHVFVHPSRNEGLPTAVLEAAAIGLPCVVTRATNVGEVVEASHAGWVVEHPDASELANAITAAITAHKQGQLPVYAMAARNMVAASFHWNTILEQLAKMYQSCLH